MITTEIAKLDRAHLRFLAKEGDKDRISELVHETIKTTRTVVLHPVFSLVGAYILIEYLQAHPADKPLLSGLTGTALEVLIGGAAVMEAVGKSGALEAIGNVVGGVAGVVK